MSIHRQKHNACTIQLFIIKISFVPSIRLLEQVLKSIEISGTALRYGHILIPEDFIFCVN